MIKGNFIEEIKKKFSSRFFELDELIQKSLPTEIKIFNDTLSHIQKFSGKRIRIILLFLFYDFCEKHTEENLNHEKNLIHAALAIEFIHNATLFHDDVIDDNHEYRRGIKPANQIWHNKLCILAGDFLLAQAFEKIIGINHFYVSKILSETSSLIIKGEAKQLIFNEYERVVDYKIENYLNVIYEKTAILFASSIKIGCILGLGLNSGSNYYNEPCFLDKEKYINAAENFGKYIGMAFQIQDDILDYFGNFETLGKSIGSDFFERKLTLPSILLHKKIFENKFSEELNWDEIWPKKNLDDEVILKNMLEKFISLLKKNDINQKSLEYVQHYINLARDELKILKDLKNTVSPLEKKEVFFEELEKILNFMIMRDL